MAGGVSVGEPIHPDLNAILHGGDTFLERVKKLADQRNAIEGMLKDLALGREARAALDDAKKKQEAATKALADAELRAGAMVRDATERSAKMLRDATEHSEKMTKDAEAAKREANTTLGDANKLYKEADLRAKEAGKLRDQHAIALKAAQDTQKAFRDRHGRLNTFLKDLLAE